MISPSTSKQIRATIGLIAIIGVFAWIHGGGFDRQVESDTQKIYDKVATDAEQQYYIALRNGSRIDQCVHAGLVAAAYLQAKDEQNYAHWKTTQSSDCKRA